MRIARSLARFLCSAVIVVVGAYTVTAMIVAGFLLNGRLVPDAWLFFDMATPALAQTSKFIGAGALIVAVAAVARHKLAIANLERLDDDR